MSKEQIVVCLYSRLLKDCTYYKIEVELSPMPKSIKAILEDENISTLKYFSPKKNKLVTLLSYGLYDEFSHWLVVEGKSSREITNKLKDTLILKRYKGISQSALEKAKAKFDELPLTTIEDLYKILNNKNI